MCQACTTHTHLATAAPALPVCHLHVINANGTSLRLVCPDRGNVREFARDAIGELYGKSLTDSIETTVPNLKHRLTLWGRRHGCLFEFVGG